MARIEGLFLGLVLLVGAGCSHVERSVTRSGEIKQTLISMDDAQFIRARGIGAAPEDAKGTTQTRGMARNAGLVSARYELLQRIRGLHLSGGLTVQELIQTDSKIAEMADDIIKGAEELSCEFTADGGAVVVIQVPRTDLEKLSRAR